MEPLIFDLFLRSVAGLYDQVTVQRYLALLVELGYHLRVLEDGISRHDREPEITSRAQQAVDEYLEQRQARLQLHASYLRGLDIELWIFLEPEKGRISFSVDHEQFNGSDEGRAAFLSLLDMFKSTYEHWHAFYGYQWYQGEEEEGVQPDRETVLETQEIHHVYTINLLGPEIVEKLSRERVMDAPAWRNEPLADGGVLLIPDNTYYLHIPFAYKHLAVALGLQTPQAPGEAWVEDIYDDPALE